MIPWLLAAAWAGTVEYELATRACADVDLTVDTRWEGERPPELVIVEHSKYRARPCAPGESTRAQQALLGGSFVRDEVEVEGLLIAPEPEMMVRMSLRSMPPSRLTCTLSLVAKAAKHDTNSGSVSPVSGWGGAGASVSVSWEPTESPSLTQEVVLPRRRRPRDPGGARQWEAWRVACWSAPALRDITYGNVVGLSSKANARSESPVYFTGELDLAWSEGRLRYLGPKAYEMHFDVPRINLLDHERYRCVEGDPKAKWKKCSEGESPALATPTVVVRQDVSQMSVSLTKPRNMRAAAEGLMVSGGGGDVAGRSFLAAAAPSLVTDTLDILADVAVKRVRSQAAELLSEALEHVTCDVLVWPDVKVDWVHFRARPLVPATCEQVRGVTFAELMNATDALITALKADVVTLGYDRLHDVLRSAVDDPARDLPPSVKEVAREHVIPLLGAIAPVVRAAVEGRLGQRETRALLATVALHEWVPAASAGHVCYEYWEARASERSLQVAVSAAGSCVRAGGCDGLVMTRIVDEPARRYRDLPDWRDLDTQIPVCDEYEPTRHPPDESVRLVTHAAEAVDIGSRLVDVALPPADVTEADQAKRLVGIVFDMLVLLVDDVEHDCDCDADVEILKAVLQRLSRLSQAAIDDDERSFIAEGLGLFADVISALRSRAATDQPTILVRLRKLDVGLQRLTPWVTTLASHAEELRGELTTPEEIEAARKAREQAIEALIATTANRTDRDGVWVTGVGASVGGNFRGFNYLLAPPTDGELGAPPPVSLPMGLALQRLPSRHWRASPADRKKKPFGLGLHLQASVVDLAYFLQHEEGEEVPWNEFLIVGGQAGVLFGTPTTGFVLGYDHRHQFSPEGTDMPGQTQGGLFFGLFVPFLDLN